MTGLFERAPDLFFPVAGRGEGISELNAFDHALLDAGIGDTNLVKMSSIVPPACTQVDPIRLPFGTLVPVAYAAQTTAEPGQWVAAAVACAIPDDPTLAGLIMEHHGVGRASEIEAQVREMAQSGMKHRGRSYRRIISIAAEHQAEANGAAFAGIVLWWGQK